MIDKETYELEWIQQLSETLGKRGDPKILEKVIHAFTLLEQLRVAGLDFIFKGGTSLLLLSSSPRRFSIDVDIITSIRPEELPHYMDRVVSSTLFSRWVDDNKRKHTANAPVGHYKFYYTSKVDKVSGEEPVLLDVLFSDNPYPKLFNMLIRHAWLQTSGETHTVVVPVIESILGDKLTAFAPTTTGILYEKDRPAEIIKQLYDIAFLFDMATDFELVRASYIRNAEEEMKYRGLNLHWKDPLRDTFETCLTITRRDEKDVRFQHLKKGITNIVNFILERFYVEEAVVCAAKTAYLSRLIQIDNIPAQRYGSPDQIASLTIEHPEYLKLNRLKKSSPEAYFYWYHALSIPMAQ